MSVTGVTGQFGKGGARICGRGHEGSFFDRGQNRMGHVVFQGADARAAEALVRAFFVLTKAMPVEADAVLPLEWCGRAYGRADSLSRLLEPLAASVVWRGTGQRPGSAADRIAGEPASSRRATEAAAPPSDSDVEVAAWTVEQEIAALADELHVETLPEFPPGQDQDRHAAHFAGDLLHEQGLEAGLDLRLLANRDGLPGLAWGPIEPHVALIWSTGRLFDRIEWMVSREWVLAAEWHAALWAFSVWSTKAADRGDACRVREQEFALVDRPFVSTSATPLEMLMEDSSFDEVPALQRALAHALCGSSSGVFKVPERPGADALFEAVDDRRTFKILDHGSDLDSRPWRINLGRLIPFQGGYLRSLGVVGVENSGEELEDGMARGLTEVDGDELPRALLIEGMITGFVDELAAPAYVPPTDSPTRARELFEDVAAALLAAGVVANATDEGWADELRQRGWVGREEYGLDQTLLEWMKGLDWQAREGQGHYQEPRSTRPN